MFELLRKQLARLLNVAEESLQREILTMQSDGSVVVSDLAVFVLVLVRPVSHQCCTRRSLGSTSILSAISTLPCTPSDYHSCSEVLRKRLARLQILAV